MIRPRWGSCFEPVLIAAFTALFILVSCTSTRSIQTTACNQANSTAQPAFLDGWEIASDDTFAIYLDEAVLWETGDEGGDIFDAVIESASVEVNGRTVSGLSFGQLTTIIGHYDENRNIVGSHGGGIQISFRTNVLSDGENCIDLRFESPSGTIHSHAWIVENLAAL